MAHFDVTTGVLDSWDLLNINPRLDSFLDRNKESVQVSSLNLFTSSTALLLKKTSYTPVFNSISAGYYPVSGGFYKTCPPTYDKPLIHVTVSPNSPRSQTTASDAHKRNQRRKKTPTNSEHAISSKTIYIVVPGTKKDKVYAIETTNAKIFKEINDNKLLSECMIQSYFRKMNKAKKNTSDKVKEKGNQLKTIPECSPACAFMNMNKRKNVSPDKSGSASPRSPVRSHYKTEIESQQSITTTHRTTKSPDRFRVKDDDDKAKSPVRSIRQKAKFAINQTDQIRKESPVSPDRTSFISCKRSIESVIAAEKRRSPERYEKKASSPNRGGRIRITGRLGLDEDDKCVLNCNATLNDEPIPTQFQGATCAMLPMCFQARHEEIGSSRNQRDATAQANERGPRIYSNEIRKESQATQVDFQILYSTDKHRRDQCGRGRIMQQCACVNTDGNKEMMGAREDTGIGLNKQHSPLIVISVYSKNTSCESSGDIKQKQTKTTGQKKENKATARSRSPSPAKSPKKIGDKKSESRVNASTSKKTIRETSKKEVKSKVNQSQSKSVVRSITTKSKFESRTNKNKSSKRQKTPPQSRRSASPPNQEDDKAEQMKRALIDDFTKTYTEQINQRNAQLEKPLHTKHNVSNITIDIEGDSDYYNVKLEQDVGSMNTEFTVRKPSRGKGYRGGDMIMGETDTTSMENFLYMPEEEPRKLSFSQTLMFDGTDQTMNSDLGDENELNVKDSIEISHMREHRTSLNDKRERNDIPKEVDFKKCAQSKHFQGDDCSISDQDARDREIRKLLGIDKGVMKCKNGASQPSDAFEKGSQASLRSSQITTTNTENLFKKDTKDAPNTIIVTRPLYRMSCKSNIQLLYRLSLHKPKRIVLTRNQYAKVKRTIYTSLISKHNCSTKWYNHDRRLYDCRFKILRPIKDKILHYDKDSQTDNGLLDQLRATSDINTYTIDEINCADANSTCIDGQFNSNTDQETFGHSSNANHNQQVINYNNYYMHNVLRTIYVAREQRLPFTKGFNEECVKKAASVKDIRYRKKATKQTVRFSSSDSANYVLRGQEKNESCSMHTIFKCHNKSVTPNLGTSAYSLCNGEPIDSRVKFFEDSVESLTKKPFLKRLISCLVFRVSPASETKNTKAWLGSVSPRSSFDSYHVSTTLGAIEMSSSLYDTTASFYSDHAAPAKLRRGFLSSVRGLLSLSRKN